jgi:uncharacterized protein DUF6894
MPRYHFNLADGSTVLRDDRGRDLPHNQAAMAEAAADARHLLAIGIESGRSRQHWRLDVRSETGSLIFSLPLSEALQPDQLQRPSDEPRPDPATTG